MGRHWEYGKYVARHKWFVAQECFRHGLYWRGIVHDLSKFRPSEWFPYANYFYNPDGTKRLQLKEGYCKPYSTGDDAFDYAWLLHQHRNAHHWQFWLVPMDNGGICKLDMPTDYVIEMVCDWRGAGRAQGFGDNTIEWYEKNKDRMQLSDRTREWVEALIK